MGAVAPAGVVSVSCGNQRAGFDGEDCVSFGVAAGDWVCVAEAAGVGVFPIRRESQLTGWPRRVSKTQIVRTSWGAGDLRPYPEIAGPSRVASAYSRRMGM